MSVAAVPTDHPAVGTFPRARGRDWFVVPAQEMDAVRLPSLTGCDEDASPSPDAKFEESQIDPPNLALVGDAEVNLVPFYVVGPTLRTENTAPFRRCGSLQQGAS